jgi:hypothetical protein
MDPDIGPGIRVTMDNTVYTLHFGEISGADALALRRQAGMSLQEFWQACGDSPDFDLVAIVIWLARRINGERSLPLDAVARRITNTTALNVAEVPPPELPPDPVQPAEIAAPSDDAEVPAPQA